MVVGIFGKKSGFPSPSSINYRIEIFLKLSVFLGIDILS